MRTRTQRERTKKASGVGVNIHELCCLPASLLICVCLQPWGVDQLGAVAGIMVTASHNPKGDNGYKVYWDNGCQVRGQTRV